MPTQRDIIVQQLRKYAKGKNLKITESKARGTRDSVQNLLQQHFGAAAPSTQTLQRIFSKSAKETRIPSPIELYQLSIALNVPQIALTIDVDQPYEASPLHTANGNSLISLTNLDVFLNNTSTYTSIFAETFISIMHYLPVELATMESACLQHAYSLRVSSELRNLSAESVNADIMLKTRAVENLTGLIAYDDELMTNPALHYPLAEHAKAHELATNAVQKWNLDNLDVPYWEQYQTHHASFTQQE